MPDLIQIKEYTDSATTNIVIDTIEKNKQVLVFVSSKSSAEKTAEMISQQIKKQNMSKHPDCEQLAEEILSALTKPTKQCEREAACVKYGIAFHHAGLLQKQKTAIENAFRTGVIKCIACTPTLCLSGDAKIWHELKETPVSLFDVKNPLFVLNESTLIKMSPDFIQKLENDKPLIKISSVSGYSIKVTPEHEIFLKREGRRILVPAR